jgi:hypothetical protein
LLYLVWVKVDAELEMLTKWFSLTSDFQNLAEDPRFTELLYPDPGAELPSPADADEDL